MAKRLPEPVKAWGIWRQRPDENKGREFFFAAIWHRQSVMSEGERRIRVVIAPVKTHEVISKKELARLRELEARRANR